MDLTRAANWLRGQFSLDPQPEQPLLSAETAADTALGMVPGVGQLTALRDMERARRANDPTAGALAATGLLPWGRLGGAAKKIIAGPEGYDAPKILREGDKLIRTPAQNESFWDQFKAYRGPDKAMKWEIPDKDAHLSLKLGDQVDDPLSDFFKHPKLYRNYPEIGEFRVTGSIDRANRGNAAFTPVLNQIEVYARTPEEFKGSLIHELQHGVQHMEPTFATGANPERMRQLLQALREKSGKPPSFTDSNKAYEQYMRSMGEAEARMAETRFSNAPSHYPMDDYDRPWDKLWKNERSMKWLP